MKNYFREYWTRFGGKKKKKGREIRNVKRNYESDVFRDDVFQKCQKGFQRYQRQE